MSLLQPHEKNKIVVFVLLMIQDDCYVAVVTSLQKKSLIGVHLYLNLLPDQRWPHLTPLPGSGTCLLREAACGEKAVEM